MSIPTTAAAGSVARWWRRSSGGHGPLRSPRSCSRPSATFRFNGPFYRTQGFVSVVPGDGRPGLLAARAHEARIGLDAAAPRIAMRLPL